MQLTIIATYNIRTRAVLIIFERLIGALKTKLTRSEKLVNKPIEAIDLLELKSKLAELESLKTNFEEKQTEIEALVSDDTIDSEYENRGDLEDRLSALCAKAQRILNLKDPMTLGDSPSVQTCLRDFNDSFNIQDHATIAGNAQLMIENTINLKLPALNLPMFNGSYEKWPGFSDVFKSSVHNDRRYSDAQRLVYLRSCLTGKAADKIESLETTDANYQVASKILEKYYDDFSAVINNHVKAFFELSNCPNTSATSIGNLLDNVTKHYRALEALNKLFLQAFPIYAVISKLDSQSWLRWKEHVQSNNCPTMEELLEFLHCRKKVLEANKAGTRNDKQEKNVHRNDQQNRNNNRSQYKFKSNPTALFYATHKSYCYICKNAHFTQDCEKLLNANVSERLAIVKNLNLCINCLRSNHTVENCKATLCKTCNKKHHTLLHENSNQRPAQANFTTLHNSSHILLSTTIVHILDHEGNPHKCRALLDNGSQVHFMTEKLANKLGLKQFEQEIPLGGVNQMNSNINKITHSTIQSRLNKYSTKLTFLITPEINEYAPNEPLYRGELKIPRNIHLADPDFNVPCAIGILIGAEIFLKLLCVDQISLANNNVTLQKMRFGWILGGKIPGNSCSNGATCNLSFNLLHNKIAQFWEIENGPHEKILSGEENNCIEHYIKNTYHELESGRYVVKLPFKENLSELGDSYYQALKRFYSLEKSLARQPEQRAQYTTFMEEHKNLGHMTEDLTASKVEGYFLPHHSVIKQSSLTTKLRVVFDASAITSTGISLTNVLMVGPNVQNDLFSLLVRFRSHTYAVTADIEKMYRQIKLHPSDRKYQKILWRSGQNQPTEIFELNTITYGTAPASFLATQSLSQLADDEGNLYPNAAISLKKDFYIDDLLTGTPTIDEAKTLVKELVNITKRGGMNLRQWASNEFDVISFLSEGVMDFHFCLPIGETTKTLGACWNPKSDHLMYSSLWLLKLDWDKSVPQDVHTAWCTYRNELPFLESISINRKIIADNYRTLQIHGFCDARQKAYGAYIYLRSTNQFGENFTYLICSKSRVAPLKKLSLPRLELCAALLLANLLKTVTYALRRLHIKKIILWSDSTIAIHWIKGPSHSLKTFEANRVDKIQEITNNCEWRHVRTEHNPADLISRGISPKEILNNTRWFNGPAWINKCEENWPISIVTSVDHSEIQDTFVNLVYKHKNENNEETCKINIVKSLFERARSFSKLLRIISYCLRFIDIKIHKLERGGSLSPNKLKRANGIVIKLVQRDTLSKEIKNLRTQAWTDGKLSPLNPFLDSEGLLRVGGRLDKSNLMYDRKHPILLTKNHIVTEIIIRDQHLRLLHAGVQATINAIRDNYWIVDGKNTAVHIEIVSDLTTEAFFASLKRFFARRGLSSDLYSDNATNFKGAKREVDEFDQFLSNQANINKLTRDLANYGRINWHFIPPRSPHFGGLWEAAVKSFKHHFTRVIGERVLTYEEFTTFATEVEGILNSRPLTPISSDPNDLIALTPGHFLIGDSIASVPEHNLLDLQSNRLSSWQQVRQMKQHFWTRWNKEYLNELTVRKEWHKGYSSDIKVGRLVTIRDDNLPPMKWSIGRIINIHPGADGIVRVVTVKTACGEYKRSIKNLSPLLIDVIT